MIPVLRVVSIPPALNLFPQSEDSLHSLINAGDNQSTVDLLLFVVDVMISHNAIACKNI